MPKLMKHWCILESIFGSIWEDLGNQNDAMLVPELNQKSILCWKCCKSKNYFKTNTIAMIFGVRGVHVESKKLSQIDQKRRSTWEGILASFFDGFWWILGGKLRSKIDPRSIKNGIEKTMKKRRAPRWQKSRNQRPQRPRTPGIHALGEVPPFKAGQPTEGDTTPPLASQVL